MAIKNVWSLNVDEALVADKLQNFLKNKNFEVFFPLRSQLKDVDMVVMNLKNKKSFTIQIKGTRTYSPKAKERERFGEGQGGWIQIKKRSIFENSNEVDFFIFIIHLELDGKIKKEIELDYIVIPSKSLKEMILSHNKKISKKGVYDFYIWVNPKEKKVTEFREWDNTIDLTTYLNNFEQLTQEN